MLLAFNAVAVVGLVVDEEQEVPSEYVTKCCVSANLTVLVDFFTNVIGGWGRLDEADEEVDKSCCSWNLLC